MSNSLQSQTHLGGSPNPHAQCDERIAALESEIANLRVVLESGKAAAIAVALFDLAGKIGHPPRFSSEHDLMTFIRDFAEQAERELAEIKQSGYKLAPYTCMERDKALLELEEERARLDELVRVVKVVRGETLDSNIVLKIDGKLQFLTLVLNAAIDAARGGCGE